VSYAPRQRRAAVSLRHVSNAFESRPQEVPLERPETQRRPRRSGGGGPLNWLIGALVVLILAVAGGLFTAWIVANMRAVPGPVGAASPTPSIRATAAPTITPAPTGQETEMPRRTPTPAPTVIVTPPPFVHVVGRGESLNYIANLYGVTLEDVLAINDIPNPNRIQVGQEILIPGYGVAPTPRPRN
jgi:LysM repeat protein